MEIGSLVECIHTIRSPKNCKCRLPIIGGIYTVDGIINKPRGKGIYLAEFTRLITVQYPNSKQTKERIPFSAAKFREVPSPQEISIENILEKDHERFI